MPDTVNSHDNKRTPTVNTYYQSIARGFAAAKFLVLILFVLTLLLTFTFSRSELTIENLQYLMKFISFTNTETSITAPKINYASGEDKRLELFIGDLCYLSPEVFTIYDSRGNTIMSSPVKYTYPILTASEKFVLTYDLGGTSYAVFNTFSKLVSDTLTYQINDADISDTGAYVIATSSREHRCAVEVFDSDFNRVSRILRENYLTDVKIKPDAGEVAVMTISADGSRFLTTIELITIGHDSVRTSEVQSGIGYSLSYTDSGFVLVSDEAISFYDKDLTLIKSVKLPSALVMTDISDKYITCICSAGIVGNNYEAFIYDSNGRLAFQGQFDGKLASISHDESGQYIFILAGSEVIRINLVNRKLGAFPVASDALSAIAQGPDSFLLAMNNYALTFTDCDFSEKYFESADKGAQ